jgi:DNA-binding transcriptional regulator YhcF (GntR family)
VVPRSVKQGPPYLEIAAEIRRRIAGGQLRAGGRVPSTRQIARDWQVAAATATKALTTLRHEGLIRSVPRVGMVVAGSGPPRPAAPETPGLTRARVVAAALEIADSEGLAALSMRGVAARLQVPTMSLYRHVDGKERLVLLMTDAVFGSQPPPSETPSGWRARLERAARTQWTLCRRHPWLAQVVTINRPVILPRVMDHGEWVLRGLDGLGLDVQTMMDVHITIYSYVRGIAINLEAERQAEAETGLTEEQWVQSQGAALTDLVSSGHYPTLAKVRARGYELDLDRIFELGLPCLLDGLAKVVEPRRRQR